MDSIEFCMVSRFFVSQYDPEKGLNLKKNISPTLWVFPLKISDVYKDFTPSRGFLQTFILPKKALQPPAHFQWRKDGKNADACAMGLLK